MKRTLAEKKVLKKLGIPDFRHITKEKIVKFSSMLPYMDPEVAKKALEQFPTFKELASDIVIEFDKTLEKILSENEVSQQVYYDACNSIIASLQDELKQETLTPEERDRIENKMIRVAEMIGEKDSEDKRFLLKMLTIAGCIGVTALGTAAAILGSSTQMPQRDDSYEDENDERLNNDDVIEL